MAHSVRTDPRTELWTQQQRHDAMDNTEPGPLN